jgi:hypothetical protein
MKMGWKLAGFMLLKSKADCWIWFWQLIGRNRLDFEFELYQVHIVGNMETFSAHYSFHQIYLTRSILVVSGDWAELVKITSRVIDNASRREAQRDSAEKISKFGPNVWAEPKEK